MSKQVLDVQQMQHLQEIGLKLKPSLVHYYKISNIDSGKWYLSVTTGDISEDSPTYQYIPAYTLQDVLDALPTEIRFGLERCWLAIDVIDETVGYYYEENVRISPQWAYNDVIGYGESLIDVLYRLLCWAIENKFVETNKNE